MIYSNIKIESTSKNIISKKNSTLIEFIFDSKNLLKETNELISRNNLKIGQLDLRNFEDKKCEELELKNTSAAPDIVIIKKLDSQKNSSDTFRNYLAGLIPRMHKMKIENLQINLPLHTSVEKIFPSNEKYFQSVIEGILLGNYSFDKYKTEKNKKIVLSVNINTGENIKIKSVIEQTRSLIESVYFARDLVNEPANSLTPVELINRSKKELTKFGIKVTSYNKVQLKKEKMGAILSVGSASDNQPFLLVLRYVPKQKAKMKIALVGKGVTYDSGGLSLKPTSGMLEMKADMAGAATVIGTILAAAKNKLPVELIGVIPAVENMVSGGSYKPGDIITSYSGKTIEVKDTDAEGRIVLADALHYASKLKPDQIIDFATLTGAVVVALGEFTAGLFTKDDEIAESILSSGKFVNEPIWRMPFSDDYKKLIESEIADISNLGPRWGGAITAGKFLEFFVDEKIPYAHIDLAGPALKHKFTNYTEKYETGYGVRLMYDYLNNL
jgi:leucyl aminopeptidase